MAEPLVGVVVVNYNGGDDTLRCLDALAGLDWPPERLRLVLVDNGSTDGVADAVEAERPQVEVLRSPVNAGFASGCNLGFARLTDADHVALVNPDAVVHRGWLRAAVAALDAEAGVGAVASKVLLAGRFTEVDVEAPATVRRRGDRRPLGVRVSGVEVDGHDAWAEAQLVSGFWGPEHGRGEEARYQWTDVAARLRIPAGDAARVRLAADGTKTVVLDVDGQRLEHEVGREPRWYAVPPGGAVVDVVNSAGVVLLDDGYGADRGYLERDGEAYGRPQEVFAWSGSAVLLRGQYLRETGGFGERYFMYYEDFDLAWRGRLLGWHYLFEPKALVRHRLAASSVVGSPLFDHHVERNRLLTVARNAPLRLLVRATVRFLLITASYARRDVLSPLLRGRRPAPTVVGRRCRSFAGFVRLLPGALAHRRRLRRRRRVADAAVLAWMGRG